jgi:hypothetical protein
MSRAGRGQALIIASQAQGETSPQNSKQGV